MGVAVKFYKRFPGDIQIKTGGLSLAEFGAYDRLLDHYYAMEAPIEADEVYSIARAQDKSDREAVDKVLRRYFTVDADGNYTQERADEMIAEALPKIEAARQNGRLGGRPRGSVKKPTGLIPKTETETETETEGVTETVDFTKGSQSQNQKEQEKPSSKVRVLAPRVVDPSVLVEAGFEAGAAAEFIAHKSRMKAPLTARAWADHVREAAKAGWSVVDAAEKVMARSWRGFEAKYVVDKRSTSGVESGGVSRQARQRSSHDLSGKDYDEGVDANGRFL